MIIDHICFAVKDLEKSIRDWTRVFGYRQMTKIVTNTRQQVKVVFLAKDESLTVKLIEPCAGNRSVEKFVAGGGGFHHLCFKCDDLESSMDELKRKGAKVSSLMKPRGPRRFWRFRVFG